MPHTLTLPDPSPAVPTGRQRPPLTVEAVLAWAKAHHERHGRWPTAWTGPVDDVPGESWRGVHESLGRGQRGLPGGDSLAKLLDRSFPERPGSVPLSIDGILELAKAHFQATGDWPHRTSGPVEGRPGETWLNIDAALRRGNRGLPGGDALCHLLDRFVREPATRHPGRKKTTVEDLPQLDSGKARDQIGKVMGVNGKSIDHATKVVNQAESPARPALGMILGAAKAHFLRAGNWPHSESGKVEGIPGATWRTIDAAFRRVNRGSRGPDSLDRLLQRHEWFLLNRDNYPPHEAPAAGTTDVAAA